jgi:putative membrane protein
MAKKFSPVTTPRLTKAGARMSNLKDPRVLFAAERTLLAWNRTSLALSAFGFMIERSGVLLRVLGSDSQTAPERFTLFVGLAFILLGAFCAWYSAVQYGAVLRTLASEEIPPGYPLRWGMAVAGLVALLSAVLAVVLGIYAIP